MKEDMSEFSTFLYLYIQTLITLNIHLTLQGPPYVLGQTNQLFSDENLRKP